MPLAPRLRALRRLITLVIIVAGLIRPEIASAALTGQVSGTVTDGVTHAPLAGVKIVATSPSGTYNGITNVRGGYALVGLAPDTYTLTFEKTGYALATVAGVTVLPDDTKTVDEHLTVDVRTL